MSENEPETLTNGKAETEGKGECFVIAPIGDPKSEIRNQTNGLLEEAIRPIIEEKLDLEVIAPHEIAEVGSIPRQVIQRLLEAKLVIADLTGLNANVMYELAVRHARGRPVVPIAEKGTSLPFDITTERTIFYEENFHGLNELKPKLEDAARTALEDEEPDNPIQRAQQDFAMREAVAGDDKMEFILDRLDGIESRLGKLDSGARASSPLRSTGDPILLQVEYALQGDIGDTEALNYKVKERLKGVTGDVDVVENDGNYLVGLITSSSDRKSVESRLSSIAEELDLTLVEQSSSQL